MTLKDFEDCVQEATRLTKNTRGHSFLGTNSRQSCSHCGRTDRVETRCVHEMKTFVANLTQVLMNNGTIGPHSRG